MFYMTENISSKNLGGFVSLTIISINRNSQTVLRLFWLECFEAFFFINVTEQSSWETDLPLN